MNDNVNKFYILAQSSLAEEHNRVLKSEHLFAVFNIQGNIRPFELENHGVFFQGTRFLSRLLMYVGGKYPLLLSSAIKQDNDLYIIDLTNPDFETREMLVKRGTLHLSRTIFLESNGCYERVRITNYGVNPVKFFFSFEFESDFYDIFEVRGLKRQRRGTLLPPVIEDNKVILTYEGLDRVLRKAHLIFSPNPIVIKQNEAQLSVELNPHEQKDFFFILECQINNNDLNIVPYNEALTSMRKEFIALREDRCLVKTSHQQFNSWLERSTADLFMMLTKTPYGLYPYAGIPWYNAVFGRDGIITAMEILWLYPKVAEGVLSYLAAYQATENDPIKDSEPGKILHEQRKGEMAALNEIPFSRYYGSIDATLLFLILAGQYFDRTQNRQLIEQIWPNIELALTWIEKYGDTDGDGFIEYERKSASGLNQQGWKDSEDAIFYRNGELAQPPIALCEVQAYLFESKIQIAKLAKNLGKSQLEQKLLKEAEILQTNFNKHFWSEDLGCYVLALDKDKKPCEVLSSNAGQCLFSGIVPKTRAQVLTQKLTGDLFFSGWGVRTIASSEVRYNPMSYHNGSVWPHDNALIAWGMSRYGFKEEALKILTGLFESSTYVELNRLPELFCGFSRRAEEGPTLYPVACNPQSWAAAAVFLLIQSCLGLKIDALTRKVTLTNPVLPTFLEELYIQNLEIGEKRIDILIKNSSIGIQIQAVIEGSKKVDFERKRGKSYQISI